MPDFEVFTHKGRKRQRDMTRLVNVTRLDGHTYELIKRHERVLLSTSRGSASVEMLTMNYAWIRSMDIMETDVASDLSCVSYVGWAGPSWGSRKKERWIVERYVPKTERIET